MKEYISFDTHKHYTLVEREVISTGKTRQVRLEHGLGAIARYLRGTEPGTKVAVEATGNWYWIVDEIEKCDLVPLLVHPRKAKLMLGMINKTDKLDVHGLNRLQRTETLPTVWIAPGNLRDLRELTRTRMVIVRQRTKLKNRIHATVAKYGLAVEDRSDWFGVKARIELEKLVQTLPEQTRFVTDALLKQLDFIEAQLDEMEQRLRMLLKVTPEMTLLMTLPGIGLILAAVIVLEIGDIKRFPSAEHLSSYSGTTPRVHSSGDKTRFGNLRSDVNHYLKWAFMEAGNSVSVYHRRLPQRHVSRLYRRIKDRKGHQKAVGAVARHLSEAAFHVLTRKEEYKDRGLKEVDSRKL